MQSTPKNKEHTSIGVVGLRGDGTYAHRSYLDKDYDGNGRGGLTGVWMIHYNFSSFYVIIEFLGQKDE